MLFFNVFFYLIKRKKTTFFCLSTTIIKFSIYFSKSAYNVNLIDQLKLMKNRLFFFSLFRKNNFKHFNGKKMHLLLSTNSNTSLNF